MLPFGVTIPATVPQWSEIPEGLVNYSVYIYQYTVIHNTIYKSIRRQVSVIASYHQTASFKNHSIQYTTAVTEDVPSFTKYVLEIH